jgi:predicted RNA binding protein YcfA (HicA-like mRNA interferase family)
MGNPRPLSYRDLRKRLKKYGVEERRHGRGSHRILIRPNVPGGNQGPQYSVRCHGEGDEIKIPVINSLLDRFNIDPDDFWD